MGSKSARRQGKDVQAAGESQPRGSPTRSVRRELLASVALLPLALLVTYARSGATGEPEPELHVLLNGTAARLARERWAEELHARLPTATRIGLWDAGGVEVAWTDTGGGAGGNERIAAGAAGAGDAALSVVVDDYPFVWPSAPRVKSVDLGPEDHTGASDLPRRVVELRTMSEAPLVLLADGVLSEAECEAVVRAGGPLMGDATTMVGGRRAAADDAAADPDALRARPRTSSVAWLGEAQIGALDDETRALVRSVSARLSALARLPLRGAESMQVLRYGPTEHYHYHLDNGGSPAIAGRVLTALVYLNDDFKGGETNWPLASMAAESQPAPDFNFRNVHAVRERYGGCQTAEGLTIAPRRGSVALFYSLHANSDAKDWLAWHAACDVSGGTKWAANYWWHLGMLRAQRAERRADPRAIVQCVDDDKFCADWAGAGECEKNKPFMHQHCRKSCKVCESNN
jgi:hypothetical protein